MDDIQNPYHVLPWSSDLAPPTCPASSGALASYFLEYDMLSQSLFSWVSLAWRACCHPHLWTPLLSPGPSWSQFKCHLFIEAFPDRPDKFQESCYFLSNPYVFRYPAFTPSSTFPLICVKFRWLSSLAECKHHESKVPVCLFHSYVLKRQAWCSIKSCRRKEKTGFKPWPLPLTSSVTFVISPLGDSISYL